ncbi:MAG: preprotein translocase subunit TatC [Proteobacteria bacterium]|nr:preprotein translocase subunit TatC [Pseudomonadota bacterium]
MTFLEHLEELRRRLIISAVSVLVGMIICWFLREFILSFLLDPLYEAWSQVDGLPEPKPLNFASMLEPFVAYLKLSAVGGLFLAAPIILYQIWRFVSPGLYRRERRLALPFVVVSTLLFVGGSTMAYSLVFPIGFRFFLDFAAGQEMDRMEAAVTVGKVASPPERKKDKPQRRKAEDTNPVLSLADGGIGDASVVEAMADASVVEAMADASPEEKTPAAVPTSGAAVPTGDETWYEWLAGRVLKKDCGVFSAASRDDGASVGLTFEWHNARCGKPPELNKLRRDDEKISVAWNKQQAGLKGYVRMVAVDGQVVPGPHTYTLAVPVNPEAKRLAPVLMIKDYLAFAIRLLLAFGVIFELPILISFLALAGIVNYKQLLRFSRWFMVIAVLIGAMLTPPDVITQILLALPLMVLYFLSVLFAYLFGPKVEDEGN